jgi:hypothetical protein
MVIWMPEVHAQAEESPGNATRQGNSISTTILNLWNCSLPNLAQAEEEFSNLRFGVSYILSIMAVSLSEERVAYVAGADSAKWQSAALFVC